MSSAAKYELAALYIWATAMLHLQNALAEMGWPQTFPPIQCDNSTAIRVSNETINSRKTKSINMKFHWLRFHKSQGLLRYFWAPGKSNLVDYSTKNYPDIYHMQERKIHHF